MKRGSEAAFQSQTHLPRSDRVGPYKICLTLLHNCNSPQISVKYTYEFDCLESQNQLKSQNVTSSVHSLAALVAACYITDRVVSS